MRGSLLFLFIIVCSIVAQASSATEKDSLSIATAAVWGSSLKPHVDNDYKGDTVAINKYMRGLHEAFSLSSSDEAYYTGIMQGMVLAQRIKQMQDMGFSIDVEVFCRSLSDILSGKQVEFTTESANEYINSYISRNTPVDTVSVVSQQAFLQNQLKRDAVIKTASGLLFETIIPGIGEHPQTTDKVKVLYTGRLSDGTVFDKTEEPIVFDVMKLVKGFSEGLLLMRQGGTYRLFIPAHLGYGEKGIEGVIPGNSVLDFDVKLIEILKTN